MILLLDNYDSFVFNLARYLQELGANTEVVRSDSLTVADVTRMQPEAIVISPGPCTPNEAGISMDVIRQLGPELPILGVCLGHQAIAAALGGEVIRAPQPVHGRTAAITHHQKRLFEGMPNPFQAMRYHSLVVNSRNLPSELQVVAWTSDGIPMALEHTSWPLYGVQFHPESILTEQGHRLIANFLRLAGLTPRQIPIQELTVTVTPQDWHSEPIVDHSCRPL